MNNDSNDVYLECVKERSKLRVRIVSPGYLNSANCMFPKDIREEGRKYKVSRWNVRLITTRGKYYYSVLSGITVIDSLPAPKTAADVAHVYEDTSNTECAICFTEPKGVVVAPCGHYYMCLSCGEKVDKCPICRGPVEGLINHADFA